ncbi:zinc finger protein 516-like [Dunckerocampus dactyliophorus]|uniref:zinc finger protein 516-like n=1 Tax=Dunckerocampus dactyliophorus TaxID=161453 RepID=UPI00240578CB|nr:zinc finger protein 516-like [Dunckerocampus dactyliophorus]XP_054620260.1 zinc finger protein 516-like [Dunckerocampus dactyliophorus]XP_054620261.1 zinc finger protein 516-like [Dunckerocampus dactyliophorus]XP_054620262.1 zinc finger protein 516-like [Dunckerocampus dactyliophorus]
METKGREEAPSKHTAKAETEEDVSSGHTCGVCGRSFPLLSSLSQHMRRHTREKPYKCPYCDHRTAQKGSLKAHIRSHKLGLFSHNLGDRETAQGGVETVEMPGTPEDISGKDHKANGKVKKKASKKKAKGEDSAVEVKDGDGWDGAGPFVCSVCNQVFPQVLLLKSHMKRHRSAQDHGCRICGRRFRQAWFLQSHMRIHRVKAQLWGSKGQESPATINGVPQEPEALTNDECLYELCAGCGNFFTDGKTLRIHARLHKLTHSRQVVQDSEASQLNVTQNQFLEGLNLTRAGTQEEDKSQGRRIPELDPVCSYQAWQLATRGRLAEATEKCLGWEERLADAEVAFDTEKGEYVPIKQDKKRKQMDATGPGVKKKKGDAGFDQAAKSLAHAKAVATDKKICHKDRILLNGLGHAFYEALQNRKVKEDGISPKHTSSSRNKDQEDNKPFLCEHCDFHTADASLLRSHVHAQHRDTQASRGAQSSHPDSRSVSKASRYMDYLRKRSALLCQPYWNPYPGPPGLGLAELNIKTEKGNDGAVEGQGSELDSLLNLSSVDGSKGQVSCAVRKEGLVRHQCPYCSHTTCYPEVLWIHQRVSHRVGTSSSVAPKWAPCAHSLKSPKMGTSQWRRTGPPPFLEGKDCPALPAPRSQRTQPPGGAASNSSSSKQETAAKSQSGAKPKPQSKDSKSRASERKSGEQKRAAEGAGKAPNTRASSSAKSASGRTTAEGNFPKEGLGFMLARSHGGAPSNSPTDRLHPQRRPCDSTSAPKGADLWAAMSMWGHRAYFEPLLFAQGKRDGTAAAAAAAAAAVDTPVDFDVLSLLKNYGPHELAALYQHWGFVDPRLDPQAMLQLNGTYGNEVHSSSEASKQVTSRSTSTSGSLHKGT